MRKVNIIANGLGDESLNCIPDPFTTLMYCKDLPIAMLVPQQTRVQISGGQLSAATDRQHWPICLQFGYRSFMRSGRGQLLLRKFIFESKTLIKTRHARVRPCLPMVRGVWAEQRHEKFADLAQSPRFFEDLGLCIMLARQVQAHAVPQLPPPKPY